MISEKNSEKPDKIVDDLNSTEDREASEETHCASYQTQLGFHCDLSWLREYLILNFTSSKTL